MPVKKLTQQTLQKRFEKIQWQRPHAQAIMRAMIDAFHEFDARHRPSHFKGMALSVGQVWPEDNANILMLLRAEGADKKKPKSINPSKIMRGRVGITGKVDPVSTEKAPMRSKVRTVRMGQVAGKGVPEKITLTYLLDYYPTTDQLRAFARDRGVSVPPSYRKPESIAQLIVNELEKQQSNGQDS